MRLAKRLLYPSVIRGLDSKKSGIYVLASAMRSIAADQKQQWCMLTLTCPSRFHPSASDYGNHSQQDAHAYLTSHWNRLRKRINRKYQPGSGYAAIKGVELHRSGVPHWHIIFFADNGFEPFLRENHLNILRKDKDLHPAKEQCSKWLIGGEDATNAPISYLFKTFYASDTAELSKEYLQTHGRGCQKFCVRA